MNAVAGTGCEVTSPHSFTPNYSHDKWPESDAATGLIVVQALPTCSVSHLSTQIRCGKGVDLTSRGSALLLLLLARCSPHRHVVHPRG